jgi:phosphoglycolate phosphatase
MTRKSLEQIDAILFDLDGTLWDSVAGVSAAWQMVIDRHPGLRGPLTDDEIRSCLGLRVDDIARRIFPQVDEDLRQKLLRECLAAEHEYLLNQGGVLYPRVEEVLSQLAAKYRLAIVSNCDDGYIQGFYAIHHLDRYFCDFESFGKTGMHKSENVKLVIARNNFRHACMVGDTILDQISAQAADIPFIYARYGFGQVREFDYAINSFDELLYLL